MTLTIATDRSEGEEPVAGYERPGTQFFADPGVDRLVAVVLNLAAELWTQKEHLRLRYESDAESGDSDPDLKTFIDRIFGPFRET